MVMVKARLSAWVSTCVLTGVAVGVSVGAMGDWVGVVSAVGEGDVLVGGIDGVGWSVALGVAVERAGIPAPLHPLIGKSKAINSASSGKKAKR
jgi:hypothetical protein